MSTRAPYATSFALLCLTALPSCSDPARAATAEPPIPIKVQAVSARPSTETSRYSGSLEPQARVDLAFRVGGYVAALGEVTVPGGARPLDKGDFVKKGTVIARVRSADYAQKLGTAVAQVSEAQANQKLAEQDLERAQRLFAGKVIAKAELDSRIARTEAAKAEVAAARSRSGEAGVAVGDTVLRAPMDGVVLSRQVEVGALVSPGQPVLTLADVRTLKAVFGAPQVMVERLHVGSPVNVFVGAESEDRAPDKLVDATVTRIAPAADTSGRVFSIEAALDNQKGELRPGSVVSVRVPLERGPQVPSVPLGAVIRSPRDTHGYAVFVLPGGAERGRVRLSEVKLGEIVGNGVTVTSGLAPSERVVTVGATLLRDGAEAVVIR